MQYAAFISYNHHDRKAASWLQRTLETYRIPHRLHGRETAIGRLGARLPPIFQDREELATSSNLAESVRKGLEESHSLVVVCSPHAARSQWVNEEIRTFTALGRRDRIQCLIVAGEPNASRSSQHDDALECLPPALFESGGSEPLAADIRPGQDGRSAARLKLLAGIMGVGYDELRNREQQRRQRRLMALASASAIGFVLMAGLASYAWWARGQAIEQRDIAREKTVTAVRTVDFVKSLFTVSDPSEARGAKVTAKEVLDRGAAQIAGSLKNEPNVKAELMSTLSEVYQGLGIFGQGEELARNSLALPVTDPAVRARQYMVLASSDYRRGDYAGSVSNYRVALRNAERIRDDDGALRASILAAMGDAKARAGDDPTALGNIEEALRLDLAQFGSNHIVVARDLEALGYVHLASEEFGKARSLFERALAIRTRQQGMNHPQVSEDLNELGSIAYLTGDGAGAEHYFRLALESDQLVLGVDHPDVAITANNLARVLLENRKYAAASQFIRKAVAVTEAQRDPTNDYFAFLYDNQGLIEAGLGNYTQAEALFRKALVIANAHKHRNRAPIMTDLADLLCRRGETADGLELLEEAAPLMSSTYPDDPWRRAWTDNTTGYCLGKAGQIRRARILLDSSEPAIASKWAASSHYGTLVRRHRAQIGQGK